jgi:hypothetical protein
MELDAFILPNSRLDYVQAADFILQFPYKSFNYSALWVMHENKNTDTLIPNLSRLTSIKGVSNNTNRLLIKLNSNLPIASLFISRLSLSKLESVRNSR